MTQPSRAQVIPIAPYHWQRCMPRRKGGGNGIAPVPLDAGRQTRENPPSSGGDCPPPHPLPPVKDRSKCCVRLADKERVRTSCDHAIARASAAKRDCDVAPPPREEKGTRHGHPSIRERRRTGNFLTATCANVCEGASRQAQKQEFFDDSGGVGGSWDQARCSWRANLSCCYLSCCYFRRKGKNNVSYYVNYCWYARAQSYRAHADHLNFRNYLKNILG